MLGVTALGTWLADRHRVQVLGALAVLGGFLTPVLVGGGENRQIFLFVYNALLLAGALVMVVRHAWAGVAVLAYVLTVAMSMALGGDLLPAGRWPAHAAADHGAPRDRGGHDRRAAPAARAIGARPAGVVGAAVGARCSTTSPRCG